MSEKPKKPEAAPFPELEEQKPEIRDPIDEPHPDYPELTRREVEAARANARKKLDADRRKDAMKRAEAAEADRLKLEEGMTAGGPMSDLVEIELRIRDVSFGPKNYTGAFVQINGKRYHNGRHIVQRALAQDLLYIASRMDANERARLGEDPFAFYQTKENVLMKKVGQGYQTIKGQGAMQ